MRLLLAVLFAVTACTACTAASPATAPAPTPAPAASAPERHHATVLRSGDCFDSLPPDGYTTLIPCEQPHVLEFAGSWVLADGPWPGDEKVIADSVEGCAEKVKIKKEFQDTVTSTTWTPGKDTWPRHRTAYCMAVSIEEGTKLTGHVLR
ncbi:septum formation family protein [Nonomuraea typhae]|uniref:septum formation family protein n=1 Tax=Nonomuraea typhae TaxID=2603600 RepID=UPI0012F77EB8|nr:septum formation family protein [Nonomuraea typhae]